MKIQNILKRFVLAIMLVSSYAITAQEEVVVPLSEAGARGKLTMHLLNGSISVLSHSKNEVIVSAQTRARRNSKSKSKYGLRKIDANAVQFSVEEVDNKVRVKSNSINTVTDYTITIPSNFDLKLSVTNSGNIYVENIKINKI